MKTLKLAFLLTTLSTPALAQNMFADGQVMQCAGMATMQGANTAQAIQDCQMAIRATPQASNHYRQQQQMERQIKLMEQQNQQLEMIQMNQFQNRRQ